MLETVKLSELSETDLQALIDGEVAEGKLIDYKRELPGATDADKKEFLFDVSSFANASGGHLIYGIEEEGGSPKTIFGVAVSDTDAEIRRLQSLILASIEPRISGLELRFVPTAKANPVLVIHIPKSWVLPHMVTFKGSDKFYSRNSAGKHRLDVGELRSLFTLSDNIANQVRKFRSERLGQIFANETPSPLEPLTAKTILHIIPLQSFSSTTRISLIEAKKQSLNPLGSSGFNTRINLDGLLNFEHTHAYLQLFQNGIIETVDAVTLSSPKIIPGGLFEPKLIQHIEKYLVTLKTLELNPPFVIMLTLLGVQDFCIAYRQGNYSPKIDRDVLIIPEIVIEKSNFRPFDIKPILDAVWNAAGMVGSPNFDDDGKWNSPLLNW